MASREVETNEEIKRLDEMFESQFNKIMEPVKDMMKLMWINGYIEGSKDVRRQNNRQTSGN